MDIKLGRLEKLDLRSFWKKEATEFTPWLAQEENIQLLSEAIGIELEVQSQEASVGPFYADILCKDVLNDHYVLIENQLERTDHTHLGQVMTYAAGLDAVTIIWIAQNFTEEHRAALDWLNRITDDTFTFFGIEIELYKIGESSPAPMFKLVSKPNDWAKQVKKKTASESPTAIKSLQQDYWQEFKDFMEEQNSFLKMQAPLPQHWTNIAIGKSEYNLSATVNSKDKSINVWLNINGENAKTHFDSLYELGYKNSLSEIHKEILWDRLEDRKGSAVILKNKADFTQKSEWKEQFIWLKTYLEKFHKYFKPLIVKI